MESLRELLYLVADTSSLSNDFCGVVANNLRMARTEAFGPSSFQPEALTSLLARACFLAAELFRVRNEATRLCPGALQSRGLGRRAGLGRRRPLEEVFRASLGLLLGLVRGNTYRLLAADCLNRASISSRISSPISEFSSVSWRNELLSEESTASDLLLAFIY